METEDNLVFYRGWLAEQLDRTMADIMSRPVEFRPRLNGVPLSDQYWLDETKDFDG